ncbi:MAG: flotillin-like FloA family protein [Planctomycetes bacterium]|nr:flotillin-like FloA family protein [Planctomycetota bacterium]
MNTSALFPVLAMAAPGGGGGASPIPPGAWLVLGVVAFIVLLVILGIMWNFGMLWVQAQLSGAPISLFDLIAMRLRRVPLQLIVNARITSKKAGLDITADMWEAHYLARGKVEELLRAIVTAHQGRLELDLPGLAHDAPAAKGQRDLALFNALASHVLAGGRVQGLVEGLIAAKRAESAGINLSFKEACAIDLATLRTEGKSVTEAVTTSVNPRVIDCPNPKLGRTTIDAVAKDGIQLMVRARVTVRTKLEQFLGGATEDTIIARVGEGIVSAIGSAETYKVVLENPDTISKKVLARGLDSQTAFEIVSIDIADVDVGQNIKARLDTDKAQADLQMAQAEAERRAAMARAREQEMKAQVEENRAAVVLAEAEVPKALAESLRTGKMGYMDYFNMKNIQADTHMREQFGGGSADTV